MKHALYLPGVGRRFDWLRRVALMAWPLRLGVRVCLIPMNWDDPADTLEKKLGRIAKIIETNPNKHFIIIAESAGGSVGVQAYADWPSHIDKLVTVCGKNRGSSTVTKKYRRRYPHLVASIKAAESIYDKLSKGRQKQIYCLYSTGDNLLPKAETTLPSSPAFIVGSSSHGKTIWKALLTLDKKTLKKII